MNIPNESEKYIKWLRSVTNPKYEHNYQVGKVEKWLGDTGASCHVVGISDRLQNQKGRF